MQAQTKQRIFAVHFQRVVEWDGGKATMHLAWLFHSPRWVQWICDWNVSAGNVLSASLGCPQWWWKPSDLQTRTTAGFIAKSCRVAIRDVVLGVVLVVKSLNHAWDLESIFSPNPNAETVGVAKHASFLLYSVISETRSWRAAPWRCIHPMNFGWQNDIPADITDRQSMLLQYCSYDHSISPCHLPWRSLSHAVCCLEWLRNTPHDWKMTLASTLTHIDVGRMQQIAKLVCWYRCQAQRKSIC